MSAFVATGLYVQREGDNLSIRTETGGPNNRWICVLLDKETASNLADYINVVLCEHRFEGVRTSSPLEAPEYASVCTLCGMEDEGEG